MCDRRGAEALTVRLHGAPARVKPAHWTVLDATGPGDGLGVDFLAFGVVAFALVFAFVLAVGVPEGFRGGVLTARSGPEGVILVNLARGGSSSEEGTYESSLSAVRSITGVLAGVRLGCRCRAGDCLFEAVREDEDDLALAAALDLGPFGAEGADVAFIDPLPLPLPLARPLALALVFPLSRPLPPNPPFPDAEAGLGLGLVLESGLELVAPLPTTSLLCFNCGCGRGGTGGGGTGGNASAAAAAYAWCGG